MAVDLVIDIENSPGALAPVAAAISDAGVNVAAATCFGRATAPSFTSWFRTPRPRGIRWRSHSLDYPRARRGGGEVEDRPGVLADLTRKIVRAGVNLNLVYIATRNRVVFGSPDLEGLKAVLEGD